MSERERPAAGLTRDRRTESMTRQHLPPPWSLAYRYTVLEGEARPLRCTETLVRLLTGKQGLDPHSDKFIPFVGARAFISMLACTRWEAMSGTEPR